MTIFLSLPKIMVYLTMSNHEQEDIYRYALVALILTWMILHG